MIYPLYISSHTHLSSIHLIPATNYHLGTLKAKLARLRNELFVEQSGGGGGSAEGFSVARNGDARVALIGFPSVGKSSLLSTLTSTESIAAGYEFTVRVETKK